MNLVKDRVLCHTSFPADIGPINHPWGTATNQANCKIIAHHLRCSILLTALRIGQDKIVTVLGHSPELRNFRFLWLGHQLWERSDTGTQWTRCGQGTGELHLISTWISGLNSNILYGYQTHPFWEVAIALEVVFVDVKLTLRIPIGSFYYNLEIKSRMLCSCPDFIYTLACLFFSCGE